MTTMRAILVITCLTPPGSASAQFALGTAGILGGVSAAPQPITVGVPATILLSGAGECGQVTVHFGDGTSKALTGVKFASNASVQHTYSVPGTVTISAVPGMSCNAPQGMKVTAIVEASSPDILCVLTGCEEPTRTAAACSVPTIRRVSYAWPLEPKESVTLHGCGFGRLPQQVRLKLPLPAPGAATGLQVASWSDTEVTATVPALTGVRDQTGKLQVLLGAGRTLTGSNEVPVSFRATRELRWVESLSQGVGSLLCSDVATHELCGVHSYLRGEHANATSDRTVGGVDWVVIALGNGWALERYSAVNYSLFTSANFLGFSSLENPVAYSPFEKVGMTVDGSGFTAGAPSGVVKLTWTLGPHEWVGHRTLVQIKGPVGVPFK